MTTEAQKQRYPWLDPSYAGPSAEDMRKFRERRKKHIDALKTPVRSWLDKSADAERNDKISALLELAFEHWLSFCDEAEALEMIELNFQGFVKQRRGTVQ